MQDFVRILHNNAHVVRHSPAVLDRPHVQDVAILRVVGRLGYFLDLAFRGDLPAAQCLGNMRPMLRELNVEHFAIN